MNVAILETSVEIDDSRIAGSSDTIREQVAEYERGDRREFDLEIAIPETATGDVMAAMADIPYGETRAYGEIAERLDTAAVAVGQACANNPVPLVVPCHRVVGSDGGLNGYSGGNGIATKRRLLDLEARHRETEPTIQTRLPSRK